MWTYIFEILARKERNVDCTEEESASIKQWIKSTIPIPESGDIQTIEKIQSLFPLEYGEALDEMDYEEYCQSKKEINEEPLNYYQWQEFNNYGTKQKSK